MGDGIDLDAWLPTIKEAARSGRSVAWVGWAAGLLCLGLGLVPPQHGFLLGLGAVLLVAMATWLGIHVREHRAAARQGRRSSA